MLSFDVTSDPLTFALQHADKLPYLAREREGVSVEQRGLGFVGLPCQRTRRSGFLRGFVDDAVRVVGRLS